MVNLDRVVRVPGTWHLKDPSNPVQVGFIPGEDKTYTPDELLKYLPKATPTMDMNDALVTSGDRFEMPPELPAGDRTRHLISLAGQLAGQGYGVEYIKAEVKRTMLELCPEGQAPIDDTTLEIEIYPAIQKFVDSAAPEVPAPPPMLPDVPSVPGQGTNNDLPEMSLAERATRDVRELTNLEQFDAQLYYVEKGRKIVHVRPDGTWKVLTLDEFKTAYGNIKRDGKKLITHWLEGQNRITVTDIQYHPSEPRLYLYHGNLMVNNYEGNDLGELEEVHPAQLGPFLDHMSYMFPKAADAELFFMWLATTVQKPELRIPWMPLIISEPGVGKGWLFELLQKLMGIQNCAVIGPKDLEGGFNEYLFEKTLVLINELRTSSRAQYDLVETLKPIITDPSILVNIKFGAKGTYPIYPNIIGFSNFSNTVAIKDNDRRFWVYRVQAKPQAPEYYDKLFSWLETDGPLHVYYWLKALDTKNWSPTAPPPMTDAKRRMIESFKSEIERVLDDAIEEHEGPFVADVIARDVIDAFVETKLNKDRLDKSDMNQIKNYLVNKCAIHDESHRMLITYLNKPEQQYVEIVRNFDKWCFSEIKDVVVETERAWRVSLGQQPGATLGVVDNK